MVQCLNLFNERKITLVIPILSNYIRVHGYYQSTLYVFGIVKGGEMKRRLKMHFFEEIEGYG